MTFLNIFNKQMKEKRKERSVKIIADYREKNSLVAVELLKRGIEVEFQQLAVADYLVDSVAVERKTISDFKTSIINKRIMQQLEEIKQHKKCLLIIEGITDEELYTGIIHENAFRGFLLSIALTYQVPIIYTKNIADTASYLALLAKKSPNSEPSIRPSKIALSDEQQLQFILEGFPNIGPVTAKKLLEHFKTIHSLFNASQEELKSLIGKKSESLYKILHHVYKNKE